MSGKIAIVGAGAVGAYVGAYVGAHMVREGEDVTFIDAGRSMSRVQEAARAVDERRLSEAAPGLAGQRPSMGQDMVRGRRTEIDFLNGFVVSKGEGVGMRAAANAALTGLVTRVERGELQPDPGHITGLRLN